jgi:SAM-dependent methyltransferase
MSATADPLRFIEEISPNDAMFKGNREHYFEVGQSALRCIGHAMDAANKREVRRILDLPCGHGRVLRALKAAFPGAALTACDTNQDGVRFCSKVFGAAPVYSVEDPAQIPIEGTFDLIWSGSLLTHLDSPRWKAFLTLFESLLDPDGLLIFTTHGPYVAERLRTGGFKGNLGLSDPLRETLLGGYDRSGFGYVDWEPGRGYGISLATPDWIRNELESFAGLRLLALTERGWGARGLQDAVACVKNDR